MAELGVTENISDLLPSTSGITQLSSKELGKEDFLNLLVAELQNQNPLEPMDNKDLVLQLSQFSTLEGTQNLNDNMATYINTSNVATAASLIGKDVVYVDAETAKEVVGNVTKVDVTGNVVTLDVDGAKVPMNFLKSIYNPPPVAE